MEQIYSQSTQNSSTIKNSSKDSDDDSDHYNEEFVNKLFEFSDFNDLVEWVNGQIKNKKYNPTSFADDFSALIRNAIKYRQGIMVFNPQTPRFEISDPPQSFDNKLVMNQCMFDFGVFEQINIDSVAECDKSMKLKPSLDDYIIYITLAMLQAFSLNEQASPIMSRVILNTFNLMLNNMSIVTLSLPRHQKWAMEIIQNVRAELVSDFIKRFSLQNLATDDLLQEIVQNQINSERYNDAARLITYYKFHDKFDLKNLMLKLTRDKDPKKFETAKLLVQDYPNLRVEIVKAVCLKEDWKMAQKLVKEYKLEADDFPDMKHGILKKSVQHYLGINLYKDIEQKESLAIDRVEEMLIGHKEMMAYLVEELQNMSKLMEAKGITLRHKLDKHLKPEVLDKMKQVKYDSKKDSSLARYDEFEPLSRPIREYCNLPDDVKLEWIDSDMKVQKLDVLKDEQQFIGVDSEWRPQLSQYHTTKPSLFQISGSQTVFLIDLVALQKSHVLDQMLSEIFCNPDLIIIGFGFSSDMDQFSKMLPNMKFIKYIKNFVDAQSYYCLMNNISQQIGLAKVASQLFGKSICKVEQMSNWEMRPLRQSQKHYAALDAFILIKVINQLIYQSQKDKRLPSFQKQIKTLDQNEIEKTKEKTKKKRRR